MAHACVSAVRDRSLKCSRLPGIYGTLCQNKTNHNTTHTTQRLGVVAYTDNLSDLKGWKWVYQEFKAILGCIAGPRLIPSDSSRFVKSGCRGPVQKLVSFIACSFCYML